MVSKVFAPFCQAGLREALLTNKKLFEILYNLNIKNGMDFACFAYPLRLCVKISMPVFYGHLVLAL
jgi:hypothetical protein